MRKSLLVLMLACIFTLINAVAAFAYNPGQRTIQLLGGTLNSDKHPVHLVVSQKIDMAEVLTPEAYSKLSQAQKVRYSRQPEDIHRWFPSVLYIFSQLLRGAFVT